MRIVCPHCQAAYQVDTLIKNAVLVCHRCSNEFALETATDHAAEKQQEAADASPLPLFVTHNTSTTPEAIDEPESIEESEPVEEVDNIEETPLEEDEVIIPLIEIQDDIVESKEAISTPIMENIAEDILPPTRNSHSIKPWLILMLLLIGCVGVWQKQAIWLNHTWVRSLQVSLHLPININAHDWRIDPSSVNSQWIKRHDGSRVLLIEGRIENLLHANMVPPAIHIQLFEYPGDVSPIWQEVRHMTEPPGIDQLKTVPFKAPKQDRVLIKAKGERGFIFLIESTSNKAKHFVLTPFIQEAVNTSN